MKFFSVVANFICILLLTLLLSGVLTLLITRSDSQSLSDLIAIAQEEGWINQSESASAISEEYYAQRHAVAPLKEKHIVWFLIIFCVLFPTCWWGVKRRKQAWNYLWSRS